MISLGNAPVSIIIFLPNNEYLAFDFSHCMRS